MYESTACITVMLSSVAQGLKDYSSSSGHEDISVPIQTFKKILDYAKTSGFVDHLCLCLAITGSSPVSGSADIPRAACEACRAIWSLVDASETLHMKGNAKQFPLITMQNHHLLQLGIGIQEKDSSQATESAKFVDSVTKAFLHSKGVQVAIYYCLHQRLEASLCAGIQVSLALFVQNFIKTISL